MTQRTSGVTLGGPPRIVRKSAMGLHCRGSQRRLVNRDRPACGRREAGKRSHDPPIRFGPAEVSTTRRKCRDKCIAATRGARQSCPCRAREADRRRRCPELRVQRLAARDGPQRSGSVAGSVARSCSARAPSASIARPPRGRVRERRALHHTGAAVAAAPRRGRYGRQRHHRSWRAFMVRPAPAIGSDTVSRDSRRPLRSGAIAREQVSGLKFVQDDERASSKVRSQRSLPTVHAGSIGSFRPVARSTSALRIYSGGKTEEPAGESSSQRGRETGIRHGVPLVGVLRERAPQGQLKHCAVLRCWDVRSGGRRGDLPRKPPLSLASPLTAE